MPRGRRSSNSKSRKVDVLSPYIHPSIHPSNYPASSMPFVRSSFVSPVASLGIRVANGRKSSISRFSSQSPLTDGRGGVLGASEPEGSARRAVVAVVVVGRHAAFGFGVGLFGEGEKVFLSSRQAPFEQIPLCEIAVAVAILLLEGSLSKHLCRRGKSLIANHPTDDKLRPRAAWAPRRKKDDTERANDFIAALARPPLFV